jgi:hypothetical protein
MSSTVPGTIVTHSPASTEAYIGSPAIVVMPDGSYVASHDFFGPGTNFDEYAVYRSTDRGSTWTKVAGFIGQWWSSLFLHRGDLYTIGVTCEYGYAVIRKSTDAGSIWTDACDGSSGILTRSNRYHCAPVPVVEHEGRLWRAFEVALGRRPQWTATIASAPVDADLLDADSWTWADPYHHLWSGGQWIEGNVVVTPEGRPVDVLRANVGVGDKAAIVQVSDDGTRLSHDRERDLVDMPGGGVKFTIRFDPVSNLYWTLGSRQTNPEAKRNTLVLASSPDLRHWTIETTLLHHDDPKFHAFQYVDWVFENDDLIFLSRTAYDDGLGGAHTQHDANYLTFHRISSFRSTQRSVD